VLLLSGQIPRAGRGPRSGYYHENDQLRACATFIKAGARPESAAGIVVALDQVWTAMVGGRPGPALFEVPLDVFNEPAPPGPSPAPPPAPAPLPAPLPADEHALAALAGEVSAWRKPLLLAGGGVLTAEAEHALRDLAECLGAPVFHTAMGKCALPTDHPLAAGMPWTRATSDLRGMEAFFSPLFAEADGLLAVGCRFSQLATGTWTLKPPPRLAQIDADPEELGRHYPLKCAVHADARLALEGLLARLPAERRRPWAPPRQPREPWPLAGLDFVTPLRRALPADGIVVADITRLAYILLTDFPVRQPRTFLHPAGYVAMGYGIPAALGARAAFPGRPIVAVAGDGCFLMSGMELATAVQEKLPIVIVLVNDGSLTLIKAIQERRYQGRYLGVDLRNPDFGLFARAFGVRHRAVRDAADFEAALRDGFSAAETTLVEVRLPPKP
jgi:thiamine pyrophosphate-dependent acetolactate synthase large subunit-like protein